MIQTKFKKLSRLALTPEYATDGSGAIDLSITKSEYINGNSQIKYSTGLAFEIPKGYVGLLFNRSSCYKKGQALTNSVGVIDSDYRGEVCMIMNSSSQPYKVGERAAQMLIVETPKMDLVEVTSLNDTTRGAGGYGSTGKYYDKKF